MCAAVFPHLLSFSPYVSSWSFIAICSNKAAIKAQPSTRFARKSLEIGKCSNGILSITPWSNINGLQRTKNTKWRKSPFTKNIESNSLLPESSHSLLMNRGVVSHWTSLSFTLISAHRTFAHSFDTFNLQKWSKNILGNLMSKFDVYGRICPAPWQCFHGHFNLHICGAMCRIMEGMHRQIFVTSQHEKGYTHQHYKTTIAPDNSMKNMLKRNIYKCLYSHSVMLCST